MHEAIGEIERAAKINEQQLKGIKTLRDLVRIKIHSPSIKLESAARAILDAPIQPPPERHSFKHRFLDPLNAAQSVPWVPPNLRKMNYIHASAIELGEQHSFSSPSFADEQHPNHQSAIELPSISQRYASPPFQKAKKTSVSKTLLKNAEKPKRLALSSLKGDKLLSQEERDLINDDPTKAIWQFQNERTKERSKIKELVHRQSSNLRSNYFSHKYSTERSRSQLLSYKMSEETLNMSLLPEIGNRITESKREKREKVLRRMAELFEKPEKKLANIDSSISFQRSVSKGTPSQPLTDKPSILFDPSKYEFLNRTGISNPFEKEEDRERGQELEQQDSLYDEELGQYYPWSESEYEEEDELDMKMAGEEEKRAERRMKLDRSQLGRIQSVKNEQNAAEEFDSRYMRIRAKSRLQARMNQVDVKRKGLVDSNYDRLLIQKFQKQRVKVPELPPVLKVAPQSRKSDNNVTDIVYKAVSQKIINLDHESIRTMRRASRNEAPSTNTYASPSQRNSKSTPLVCKPVPKLVPLKIEKQPISMRKKSVDKQEAPSPQRVARTERKTSISSLPYENLKEKGKETRMPQQGTRGSDQLHSIESVDQTITHSIDSKIPSRPQTVSKILFLPQVPQIAVKLNQELQQFPLRKLAPRIKRFDSETEAVRSTPSNNFEGVVGTHLAQKQDSSQYREQGTTPGRKTVAKVVSLSPKPQESSRYSVQMKPRIEERKWNSTSPQNSARQTKLSQGYSSNTTFMNTGFSAGRFNRYPRFTVFINNPSREDLNTMRFSPQVMDILLGQSELQQRIQENQNILLDVSATNLGSQEEPNEAEIEKLEELQEDVGEQKTTMDQATTPIRQSKPESVAEEVIREEKEKSLRMFDPFDRVAVGRCIPNAILTSVRSYTGQNNMISDSLRIIHQNFKPPPRLQSNNSRLDALLRDGTLIPLSELQEQHQQSQEEQPKQDDRASTGLRTFLNRDQTQKLQLYLAGPNFLQLVEKNPMKIVAFDKTVEVPQTTELVFSSTEQKIPMQTSIDSPIESELDSKRGKQTPRERLVPTAPPVAQKRTTLAQRIVATAPYPQNVSETPYSMIEEGRHERREREGETPESPVLSGRLVKGGRGKRRDSPEHKIDVNLLKERIEQEKRLIQERKERQSSRKGDGLSSDQFTFRESQQGSSVHVSQIIRRPEMQGKQRLSTLQTASQEATNSIEESIHPNHSRYSSAFSRAKKMRSSVRSSSRESKKVSRTEYNTMVEGMRATFHNPEVRRTYSPTQPHRNAILKVSIVSPQLVHEASKPSRDFKPERRVLRTSIRGSRVDSQVLHREGIGSSPQVNTSPKEEMLSQESSEVSSIYKPMASPLNQTRSSPFAKTSGSIWRVTKKQRSNTSSPTHTQAKWYRTHSKLNPTSQVEEVSLQQRTPSKMAPMAQMASTYSESLRSFHTSEANMNHSFRGNYEVDTRRKHPVLIEEEGHKYQDPNADLKIVEVKGEDAGAAAVVTISSQPRHTLELADPSRVAVRREGGELLEVPRLQTMNNPVIEKDLTQLLYQAQGQRNAGKKKKDFLYKHKILFRASRAPHPSTRALRLRQVSTLGDERNSVGAMGSHFSNEALQDYISYFDLKRGSL